jgi:hypothetical protein
MIEMMNVKLLIKRRIPTDRAGIYPITAHKPGKTTTE